MKRTRTVGRNARAAWVTRAEAAYLARVSIEEIDRWIASGRLANRQVGAVVLVDLSGLREPGSQVDARSVRGARARSGRAIRGEHRAAVPEPRPESRPAPLEPRASAPSPVPDVGAVERPHPAELEPPRAATVGSVYASPATVDVTRSAEAAVRAFEESVASFETVSAPASGTTSELDPRAAAAGEALRGVADTVNESEPTPSRNASRRGRLRIAERVAAAPRGAVAVGAAIGATTIALFAMQVVLFRPHPSPVEHAAPVHTVAPAASAADQIPVGRDPFASPFAAKGTGDRTGGVLVKPPAVVRHGDDVTAATTVVNQSRDRWLPPSEVLFVARDATGAVIARTSASVTLGPGRSETVVAPDLGVDPAAIAAIEAHIDAVPMRSGGYDPPAVNVRDAAVTEAGKAVIGTLDVSAHAGEHARLACVVFDTLDELAAVGTTDVDVSKADGGRLRFWMSVQPDTDGPYHVSCSVG